jgi:NAD(P)-dependent dehydrogenase (short-subunit alcohol dehydrogenase family)
MFSGKVALVTGAASGLGRAIALMIAGRGAKAVVGLDKDKAGLAAIGGSLRHPGIECDVSDHAEVAAAIGAVEKEFGHIDLLVICAGILQPPPVSLQSVSERQFDKIIDVNLKGAWNIITLTGQGMCTRGTGAIVTIASITALSPGPLVPYGPAKAALMEMTKSFAGAWGASGVRVNCVAPGFSETPALARGADFGVLDLPRLASATALGRLPTADEIAEAACFLLSPAASGITGAVLPVDCGALVMSGFSALDRKR